MVARLVGAIQFLTIVPIRYRGAMPAQSAPFFPVAGALLGLAGWALWEAFRGWLPMTLTALLVVKLWSWLSGSLHEDGLADSADAFRAGRSPEKIHSILKDSRIGTYGAVALIFSIVIRWQALVHLAVAPLPAFIAAQAIPRAAIVALTWISRPAGRGSGAYMAAGLSTPSALTAIAFGLGAAALCGPRLGVILVSLSIVGVLAARRYFYHRIGGITGDCLGALCQVLETTILVFMACRTCSW